MLTRTLRKALPLSVMLLIFGLAACLFAQQAELKLNLEEGQSYRLRNRTSNQMLTTMQGREMETGQDMDMVMAFDVQDVAANGDMSIGVTFESVKAEIKGPMGDISYDSETGEGGDNPMTKVFAGMAGKSYTMVINPRGEVQSTIGLRELMNGIVESMDTSNEQAKQASRDMMERMFGDDGGGGMAGMMFKLYPDQPVSTGESWSKTITPPGGMSFSQSQTYTLKELSGGEAVLDQQGEISTLPDAEPMTMGPMKIRMDISGTNSGTVRVDLETGWINSGSMTQQMSGKQMISGGPAGDREMTIPIEMQTETTWETL